MRYRRCRAGLVAGLGLAILAIPLQAGGDGVKRSSAGMALVPVAADQQPLPIAALCDSGYARLERGDVEGARALFVQALEREREYPRAVLGMGRVWLETENGVERALEYLRQATALSPTDPATHYWRALAHLKLAPGDLGRQNATAAREELELVLALDPSHSDAAFRLGYLLREVLFEPEEATALYRRQIAAFPDHREARLELLILLTERGEWYEAVEIGTALVERFPEAREAYPYLAGVYWKLEQYAEAMDVFELYFGLIEPQEMALYLDMSLILTPTEQREYDSLDEAGRRTFRAHYWGKRDPDPQTMVNERLLEHFIRVAWARLEFGQTEWPWDGRGRFYVRYGEPDIRAKRGQPYAFELVDDDYDFLMRKRDFYESMGISSDLYMGAGDEDIGAQGRMGFVAASQEGQEGSSLLAGRDPERWIYLDEAIDIHFVDDIGAGAYFTSSPLDRQTEAQMEVRLPTMSEEEEKIEVIDPMDSVVTFKGEGGRTVVEYAFALLPDEFGAFRSVTGAYATLDVEVKLFSPAWEEITGVGEKSRRLETVPQVRIRGIPLFVDATRIEVEPGEYILSTMLLDPVSGRRATAEEQVELPDYSGSELIVSNILPAARIREIGPGQEGRFVRGELEVLPLPGRALQADQPLYIYYEIYNLTRDTFGSTSYTIDYSVAEAPEGQALATRLFQGLGSLVGLRRGRAVVSSTIPGSGISSDLQTWLEIDLGGIPPDTYELRLTVTDENSGEKATSSLIFRTLPLR